MFKRAVIKQTAVYMMIIMGVSLFFSLSIFRISSSVFNRNFRRQTAALVGLEAGPMGRHRMITVMEEGLAEGRGRLIASLLYANLFILASSGIVSYYLALSTIRPIEEAHEAQVRFSADASHELRSPLAAMRTEIEVALRDPSLQREDFKDLLKSNLEEIGKLTELSESLLKLAQVPSASLTKESMPLTAPIEEALRYLAEAAKAKGITILTQLDQSHTAYGNMASLTELFVIILENAIKYSPEGQVVKVVSQRDSSWVKVKISDQGIGMNEETKLKIFDRFYRADSSRFKNGAPSYGLGLSIAKRIVELHQGKISVESRPGQGSVFIIELPS